MSVHVESWAWRQKVGSAARKLVLVKLAQNADDDGWSWWRQSRIAEECEMRRETVNRHIAALRGLGLLQVIEWPREQGGGRGINRYRVLVPEDDGDVTKTHSGRDRDAQPPVTDDHNREPSVGNRKGEEGPQTPTGIEPLGRMRFRVPSNSTKGRTYTVDLNRGHGGRCTCPAGRRCRHLEAAWRYLEEANTDRRREFRDALWDVLVDLFGKPTERGEADRGLQVAEVAELMFDEVKGGEPVVPYDPEAWAAEVRTRYAALVREWGTGKVTLHSLVKNWHLAGRLVRPVSNTVGQQPKLGYTKIDN